MRRGERGWGGKPKEVLLLIREETALVEEPLLCDSDFYYKQQSPGFTHTHTHLNVLF